MVTVEKAVQMVMGHIPSARTEVKSLEEILGCILAQDVRAAFDLPRYDNSAMDGFVLRSRDTELASPYEPISLKIRGVIRAGDGASVSLQPYETYRIMTGAPIPKGGDTILPKEEAVVHGPTLILNQRLPQGRHIRWRGEELQKGRVVLKKNFLIHPGTIGVLATLGKDRVKVFKKPKVAVISTGSELVQPGKTLGRGQIYDSNSWMLTSALKKMEITPVLVKTVPDEPGTLKKVLDKALQVSDVVILTGGVSVGDYDYVKEILEKSGVNPIFWKVHQKPGKPLFFGKRRRTLVFGLPGNPASVYICFYEYVVPALWRMAGKLESFLSRACLGLAAPQQSDPNKFLYLKGKKEFRKGEVLVRPLFHQGSHMVSSLHEMDSIIRIPPGKGRLKKGSKVEVDLLPK